jgi:hypothetical protein
LIFAAFPATAFCAGFHDIGAGLPGIADGSVAWGDYDNDGDLDILLAGLTSVPGTPTATVVYRSSGGAAPGFARAAQVPSLSLGAAVWGDYDNDGWLDILATGYIGGCAASVVYRNNGGPDPTFSWVPTGLPAVYDATAAWGDYDNDGDLDILLTGALSPYNGIARIYRNDPGAGTRFNDAAVGLPGAIQGSGEWGDYDADGDLDILLTGATTADVYRNDGGSFAALNESFGALARGSSGTFGDYDADGDLDILLTGEENSQPRGDIYRAANGFFSHEVNLTGVHQGTGAWGDYDNDGDLDALAVGADFSDDGLSTLYRNDPGPFIAVFNDMGAGLAGVGTQSSRGAAAWGDVDNDGDLDILLGGRSDFNDIARVYRNDEATAPNAPPSPPTNLSSSFAAARSSSGTRTTFSWSAATDAETPAAGLTYNLRVGTAPGADDVVSAMSDPATGARRVPAAGNAGHNTAWDVELPGSGPYYWSVQAVDGSFAGSAFASETVTGPTAAAPAHQATSDVLMSGAPNPFAGATTIRFSQAGRGPVSLRIYDVAGRRVRTLDDGHLPAGQFARTWDGTDDGGRSLPAGVYFARLKTAALTRSEKIVLVR